MAGALQVTGICSVAVQVRNLDRSLAFYRDVLGLRLGTGRAGSRSCMARVALPRPSSCLRWANVPSTTVAGQACPGRVAGRHANRSRPGRASAQEPGLPCQRRREDGGDIVDTRDPDRTHVLLVWLDDAQLAGDRLPPGLYTHE